MKSPHLAPLDAPDVSDDPAADAARALDRSVHAAIAPLTGGLSPVSLSLAFADWAMHLAASPGTAWHLLGQAQRAALETWLSQRLPGQAGEPSDDQRFRDPAWQQWPYAGWAQWQQQAEAWWSRAVEVGGVDPHHRDVVRVFARQWLDMLSPSNWPMTNPQVLAATQHSAGDNLRRGAANWLEDLRRVQGLPPLRPEALRYQPGTDVAVTPGQVVHRNHLIELIQYAPSTPTVEAEPVFILPSWIMKYYILDLSPQNSMVKYLVSQGHTVFIASWRNPDERDALLDMEDYLQLGVFDALAAIGRLTGMAPVHAVGYCLGGTLMAIGAAALSRQGQVENAALLPRLQTLSLLAAETDFLEPGELSVLIDESQVQLLEDMMAERGFLSGRQMAGSFAFLHSRELVWTSRMRAYLLGEQEAPNDLMAWNADVTRMPAAMHSEYLRSLYLRNDLAEGRYLVEGRPISLSDIRVPVFVVGTVKDHVSPWHSVYKIHRLTDTEVTFVLTNGGHNAGIVSEPGHRNRRFQMLRTDSQACWMPPEQWADAAPFFDGSWWPAWSRWLIEHDGTQVPARAIDPKAALGPAPGTYVQVRYPD